ncbi:hypothetical protein CBM2586_P90021 [Cupriavidus phytorum]|uniref:Uncharacterized protein n=1 Tax=Cupriavidus taiwanensis TaxID=164546 RepID=A0A375CSS0_9BURK|nr:hypothetical protein CBM2588_P100051 [Cupriavidus taiwanensis]SOY77164.1 hypothetical protein CBM2585_P90049 [Cupriavidus taiwanensis]SOY78270.1 hypothetical protein CBM2586_P90021 [Cupriavidus taiwanensis]SOY98975.1 hypothetical protein CBM2591_P120049 [Cupriavidus taiwanensis]SOZ02627.1 hypothetical protein CBM2600_P90021 [Cupriavidus taiwanensis]
MRAITGPPAQECDGIPKKRRPGLIANNSPKDINTRIPYSALTSRLAASAAAVGTTFIAVLGQISPGDAISKAPQAPPHNLLPGLPLAGQAAPTPRPKCVPPARQS